VSLANPETVTLAPTVGVAENSPEPTLFSVPVVAFPSSYDYGYQWGVGLIVAGLLKRAKFYQYAAPFILGFVSAKEPYRRYKYRNNLHGAKAWNAWYRRFAVPVLRANGRPLPAEYM